MESLFSFFCGGGVMFFSGKCAGLKGTRAKSFVWFVFVVPYLDKRLPWLQVGSTKYWRLDALLNTQWNIDSIGFDAKMKHREEQKDQRKLSSDFYWRWFVRYKKGFIEMVKSSLQLVEELISGKNQKLEN